MKPDDSGAKSRIDPHGCWCAESGIALEGGNGIAQVAERLMAADCKSAAPWSYGGSNPPLCTIKAVVREQLSVVRMDRGGWDLRC
jgi:hypothetical protein